MASTPPEPDFQFNIGEAPDSLERMCELNARFGDIYRLFVPSRRGYVYVINHPDDVKRVLVSNHGNYLKGFGLDRVRMLLGNGIVTSDGDLWRKQRYLMQPMFHRRIVTQFGAIIERVTARLIERWRPLADQGQPINVTDEMSEVTLDFILRAVFGDDLDRLTRTDARDDAGHIRNERRRVSLTGERQDAEEMVCAQTDDTACLPRHRHRSPD